MDSSITVALITSGTGIIIALIGAYVSSGKAVRDAREPLLKEIEQHVHDKADLGVMIAQLREKVIELRGDPDEP